MRRILIFVSLAFSTIAFSLNMYSQDTIREMSKPKECKSYKLEELIDIALNNTERKISDLDIEKSIYKRNATIGKMLPNIDIKGSYANTLKKQKMYFDLGKGKLPFGGAMDDGFEVGQTHNIQAGIQVGMPIFAPQLWEALSIDQSSIKLSLEKSREGKLSLINEVKKSYLTVLLAHETYEVLKRNYEQAQDSYNQIKKKFDKGLVAEFDLIRQETKMKSVLPNVINAENSIKLANAQLNILLDRDPNDSISVVGKLDDYQDILYKYVLDNDTDSIDVNNNTTIKQLNIQKEIAQKAVKTKWFAYLPSLSLGFVYQYSFMANNFDLSQNKRWSPYSMINLNFSIPIFSSGSRYYDLKQSKIDLYTINLRETTIKNKLGIAIMNQRQQIYNSCQAFIAAKDAVKTAEKGYEIAKVRYATGSSSLLELNDAELALLQAKLNYNKSIYDFMKAKFDLDNLQGKEYNEIKK